ncbi:hypothetical protein DSL72_003227 [Monilinia vaccinii-corymbosi]|uniref:Rhodopsin domain-containing protein n=1 Tax=Monilinia vaccinii-corymbosi TaxID=61207 RepID=A0A8A3NSP5_9HELO|nr:hypothetical protein DSL72_003227 [Monilinia vaccinii-corymbosi]
MEGRQLQLYILITIGLILTWTSVGLRCYTRIFVSRTLGSDDYWMIFALAVFTVISSFGFVACQSGVGVHAKDLNFDQLITGAKYEILVEITYIICTAMIKTSVGLLLLRITSVKPLFRYIIWSSIAIIWVWTFITLLVVCLQCKPLTAAWDPLVTGECLDVKLVTNFAYALSAETIFFDWSFSLLPIPMLWNMKMTIQMKIVVMAILGVGVMDFPPLYSASCATIIRLRFLIAFENLTDPLYTISPVFFWSSIELILGITAASLATLRPLLRSWHILGFTGDRTSSHGAPSPGRYINHSSGSNPSATRSSSSGVNSLQKGPHSLNLHTQNSASAGSELGILERESRFHSKNGSSHVDADESLGKRENNDFELMSQPDGLTTTELPVEYAERMRHVHKDMV